MKAFIFDLDGTLIDSVYPHTLAWQKTLSQFGIEVPAWEIHRRIGMSGRLLVKSVARARNRTLSDSVIDELDARHSELFHSLAPCCGPLPGARDLLAFLRDNSIAHGIATSGKRSEIEGSLQLLDLSADVVIIDGTMVAEVKPEPDLFLACREKLGFDVTQCVIAGDAVWDIHAARRAGILSVGLLSGGFGEQELYNAGAMRVYKDAAGLHAGIDELGFVT